MLDWHAADQWSLGICLYIMLTARPLYAHPDDRAFEILATGGAPALLRHYAVAYGLTLPDGAMELVCALLRPDPRDRPTVEEVLLHPWVRPAVEGAARGWLVGTTAPAVAGQEVIGGWGPPQGAIPESEAVAGGGVVKQ